MKKILFVNNNLHTGGVQRALINLLWEIRGEYEISLLLFAPVGELMDQLPPEIELLTTDSSLKYWGIVSTDANTARKRLARSFWAICTKLLGRGAGFRLASFAQRRLGPYDVAISFLHSGPERSFYGGCNEFVLRCVQAERKYSFLHCDYEKISADSPYNRGIYQQFDAIAACSEGCKSAFLRVMPELAPLVWTVPNCQDYARIRRLSDQDPVSFPRGRLNLLSVSRLGREKGILRAVQAISELGSAAEGLSYTIIGDGAERSALLDLIEAHGLQQIVSYLGAKENPYPFMKAADCLLIPSFSEAAPMVIGEAAFLGTPILATETSSAQEMIEVPGYGLVCENSTEGIRDGVQMLLEHPEVLEQYRKNCRIGKYQNEFAHQCFSCLIADKKEECM